MNEILLTGTKPLTQLIKHPVYNALLLFSVGRSHPIYNIWLLFAVARSHPVYVCGRVVPSLLQLLERWPCQFWFVDKMKFASLVANSGRWGLLVYSSFLSIGRSHPVYVCGRVVPSLLQLSERWLCHIWFVDRMKFASLEANLCWWGLLVYSFFLSIGRSHPVYNTWLLFSVGRSVLCITLGYYSL